MVDEIKKDTVDYRDPTPFDDSKLQSLSEVNKAIRHKMFNKDVREPIAQGFENLVALMQEKGGNPNAEVVAARGKHELLQIREDAQDNAIVKAQSTANSKFDANQAESYLKSVTAIPETFANLAAIKAKYPSGKNGVMVAADNGHKYIWSNNTWTDAGIYQSAGQAENSVGYFEQTPRTMPLIFASGSAIDFDFNKGIARIPGGVVYNKDRVGTNIDEHTFAISSSKVGWIVFDTLSKTFKLQDIAGLTDSIVGWIWNGDAFVYGAKVTINGESSGKAAVRKGALASVFSKEPIIIDRVSKKLKFQSGYTIRTQDGSSSVVKLVSEGGTQPDEIDISGWNWLVFDKDYQQIVFGESKAQGANIYYFGYSIADGKSVAFDGANSVIKNEGVKIACLGDSFTEGVGTTKRYFEFWNDLLKRDGMQANFTNLGVGSTTIADTGWKPDESFVDRYVQVEDDTNIVTIQGGANDFNYGAILGEVNSTDATTFCGGLNTIIDGLRAKNPSMTIVCMTPTKAYYEDHNWDEWTNSQDLHLIDYVNAMKAVCQNKSVNCIDLYSNSGYNPIDENIRTVMSSDGLHPNAVGHEKIARYGYPVIRANVLKI